MNNCIVVVPVYNPYPDIYEISSFKQTLKILQSHDICVVTFLGCDIDVYNEISIKQNKKITIEFFDKKYFGSIEDYNDLCFSTEFYNRFSSYKYMLICQLDVWLFSDQLDYWCNKEYDYVGAPLYHAYNKQHFTTKYLGVGNGGLSLRNISHCMRQTTRNRYLPFVKPIELIRFYWHLGRYTEEFTQHFIRRCLIIPTVLVKILGFYNTLNFYISNHVNEDLIFGSWSNNSWRGKANLPNEIEAAKFSFEVNPSYLYDKIGHLPFGCHAFRKWEYESFWKKYISIDEA